jgi:hypothetical protein
MPDNDAEGVAAIASVSTIVRANLSREAKLEAHADTNGAVVTVLIEGRKPVRLMFSIGEDNGILVTDAASAAAARRRRHRRHDCDCHQKRR